MPKKKKKERRRRPAIANADPQPPPRSRRLPAPRLAGGRSQARKRFLKQPYAPEGDNPYILEIVRLIERVSAVSGLNPYVILTDWIGMMEASLRMWPENMKAMAMTGKFVKDPPEIEALFARVRARYLRTSEQYPAVYRQMQESFAVTFALLLESSSPGLAWYGQQTSLNPDVIGQVFMTCLQPGRNWGQFFPPWEVALTTAGQLLPKADELVYLELAQAALRARCDGHSVALEPGQNFPEWLAVVQPYCKPLVITEPINSSMMMLALATRFSDWIIKHNLVYFHWPGEIDPLLRKMAAINARLYSLNSYLLEHVEAMAGIQAYFEKQAVQDQPIQFRVSPAQVYRVTQPAEGSEPAAATETVAAPRQPIAPLRQAQEASQDRSSDTKSFSDLFKRSEADHGPEK